MTPAALDLDPVLLTRLTSAGARVDVADANTLALKNVPANAQRFTKARTNLLVQRPRAGLPYVLGVDEDLAYVGPDQAVARLFAAGHLQRGWRVLRVELPPAQPLDHIVERALKVIGFDGAEPVVERGPVVNRSGLLAAADNLTSQVRAGSAQPTAGRGETVESVVTALLQWQPRLPVIVGGAGVGKTNLLHAVAASLARSRPLIEVLRLDLSETFAATLFDADREGVLEALLKQSASPELVVCLERIDLVLRALPQGPLMLAAAVERGVRIAGTTPTSALPALRALPCAHRFQVVELSEPGVADTLEILRTHRGSVAAHHQVDIDEQTLCAVVARAETLEGLFPLKALALLDSAACRANLAGAGRTEMIHVLNAARDCAERADAAL